MPFHVFAYRKRRSARVLRRFRQWLKGVTARPLPPSDRVGKVARYYLKHFDDLTRFVDHAELPLDNNAAEREFQRHAKLRQASMFAGSVEGGQVESRQVVYEGHRVIVRAGLLLSFVG